MIPGTFEIKTPSGQSRLLSESFRNTDWHLYMTKRDPPYPKNETVIVDGESFKFERTQIGDKIFTTTCERT